MLALEISASVLSLITFVVMFGLSVLGYFSLRRHIRGIDAPGLDKPESVDEDEILGARSGATPSTRS